MLVMNVPVLYDTPAPLPPPPIYIECKHELKCKKAMYRKMIRPIDRLLENLCNEPYWQSKTKEDMIAALMKIKKTLIEVYELEAFNQPMIYTVVEQAYE